MKTSLRRITAMAAGLVLLGACASEPTSPPMAPAAAPPSSLLGTLGGLVNGLISVPGVLRTSPLANSISVSQTIGTAGGTLTIPAAGVTVVVPSGALNGPTLITMTARSGSLVAYDFAPHGIVFNKPLVFTQKLTGTNASLLSVPFLKLGYYSDPNLLTAVGGLVSELLGGTTNLLSWTFTSNIKHFSGYVIACGRVDSEM